MNVRSEGEMEERRDGRKGAKGGGTEERVE